MQRSLPSHFPTVFSARFNTCSSSASAPFQCTEWRLQAVLAARCTMGIGGLPSQSRNVGITVVLAVEVSTSWSGIFQQWHVVTCGCGCRDHSALELDGTACSLSPVRYGMCGVSAVAVHGRVLVCPQGCERGSSCVFVPPQPCL
jgi:hypothetical protein